MFRAGGTTAPGDQHRNHHKYMAHPTTIARWISKRVGSGAVRVRGPPYGKMPRSR
jgi:hypothetical protein